MAKISTHTSRAAKSIEVAWTYAGDGALHSAARCLKEAAEHMELAAEQRDIELEKLMESAPK